MVKLTKIFLILALAGCTVVIPPGQSRVRYKNLSKFPINKVVINDLEVKGEFPDEYKFVTSGWWQVNTYFQGRYDSEIVQYTRQYYFERDCDYYITFFSTSQGIEFCHDYYIDLQVVKER
jgi:hypothetical protein